MKKKTLTMIMTAQVSYRLRWKKAACKFKSNPDFTRRGIIRILRFRCMTFKPWHHRLNDLVQQTVLILMNIANNVFSKSHLHQYF
jgi:hypothetical protein